MADCGTSTGRGNGGAPPERSENRSEIKRPLFRPEEILQHSRTDEAFVLLRSRPPLRCGRAIYFRRRSW